MRISCELRHAFKHVVLLIFGLVLAACTAVQVGRDFDPGAFETRVQRGVTTQAEVRAWLGAPGATGVVVDTGGERFSQWTYYYGSGRLPQLGDARFRVLQVQFDAAGVVRGYSWSNESAR